MQRGLLALGLVALCGCFPPAHEIVHQAILPEQRTIEHRDPSQLPAAKLPAIEPPRTVTHPRPQTPKWELSLDEAIRIALENAEVVRILAGVAAAPSGATIYDAAITNTTIDQEQGRFDPVFNQSSTWNRTENPQPFFDPEARKGVSIFGSEVDSFLSTVGVDKTNVYGGQWGLTWTENPLRFGPGVFPLDPQTRSALELTYTQPLLQGGGYRVNTAPIVLARINTEQSFFRYKDSVQELVRGVIEGYWSLVQARTDVWAREIQVQQSREAFEREEARLATGFGDRGAVAQTRVTYNQFRANLIAARALVLTREGALRNLLGLPPSDGREIVPVSAPASQRLAPDWDALVRLAEQRRPDIIELKLILEADQVRLLQAENQALPRLDLVGLYRWNGLSGIAPGGGSVRTGPGEFTDWSLGINFSVPLGLRQARAQVRQQRLLLAQDRANLDQGLHGAVHDLAITVRDLDNAYEQYLAFKETRAAALENLKVQTEQFRAGRNIFLNVLQALNDWGNAVSAEAGALLTYNVALATLERQTGTILETHGLVFFEERFKAAGPLGIAGHGRSYPSALVPAGDPKRYPPTGEPSENSFDLQNPYPPERERPEELPPPRPVPPPGADAPGPPGQ